MKAKKIKEDIKLGSKHRPRDICPSCFEVHLLDVPDLCWKRGVSGDFSTLTEFEKYLKDNKKGKIV